jgi:HK97 family phage major capsid protein
MQFDINQATPAEIRAWAMGRVRPHECLNAIMTRQVGLSDATKPYQGRTLQASEQRALDANNADQAELGVLIAELEEEKADFSRQTSGAYSGGESSRMSFGRNEAIYRPDGGENRTSFFADVIFSRQSPQAQERLAANQREQTDRLTPEQRTVISTGGGAGFIPPVYLGNLWAEQPRPTRPFADALPKMPIPATGLAVTVPRVSGGTTVASQSPEGSSISTTDITSTTTTASLVTIAGMNDVSLQNIERAFPGLDQVIYSDLRSAYDGELDRQLLNGTGSTYGQHAGIRGVAGSTTQTWTQATPTGALLMSQIYKGISTIASVRYRNADTVVMHPRRAAWLGASLSSTFPLFQQGSLLQAAGTQDQGFVKSFGGLNVILDANVRTLDGGSTNQDEVYVLHLQDLYLMEGEVLAVTFEDVLSANMNVRLRLHGFSFAITGREPTSILTIAGSGLAAPAFAG